MYTFQKHSSLFQRTPLKNGQQSTDKESLRQFQQQRTENSGEMVQKNQRKLVER